MMKLMKKMLLMAAIAAMVVSLAAPAAMAEEVQDPQSESSGTEPVVGDHPEGSSDNSSGIVEEEEEPAGGVPADDEPICMIPEGCETDEKPYQDPGIRKCDLLPIECPDDEEEEEEEDSIVCAAIYIVEDGKCVLPYDALYDEEEEEDSIVCAAIYIVEDGKCVLPYDALYDEEEEASAPGGMKAVSVSTPVDEAGQTTDSGTIHGCPFDYEYFEEIDQCLPSEGDYEIFETLFGDTPWPDSAGGYVGLLGDLVEDPVVAAGTFVQLGLGYVEEALVWYGEDFGIAGWPFLGIGYTIGFTGDVAGAVIGVVGEAAGAVADGVGEAIDAVGDAAGAVYDEISSWF